MGPSSQRGVSTVAGMFTIRVQGIFCLFELFPQRSPSSLEETLDLVALVNTTWCGQLKRSVSGEPSEVVFRFPPIEVKQGNSTFCHCGVTAIVRKSGVVTLLCSRQVEHVDAIAQFVLRVISPGMFSLRSYDANRWLLPINTVGVRNLRIVHFNATVLPPSATDRKGSTPEDEGVLRLVTPLHVRAMEEIILLHWAANSDEHIADMDQLQMRRGRSTSLPTNKRARSEDRASSEVRQPSHGDTAPIGQEWLDDMWGEEPGDVGHEVVSRSEGKVDEITTMDHFSFDPSAVWNTNLVSPGPAGVEWCDETLRRDRPSEAAGERQVEHNESQACAPMLQAAPLSPAQLVSMARRFVHVHSAPTKRNHSELRLVVCPLPADVRRHAAAESEAIAHDFDTAGLSPAEPLQLVVKRTGTVTVLKCASTKAVEWCIKYVTVPLMILAGKSDKAT